MKTRTDEELQAAIDVAFSAKTGEAYLARRPDVATKSWPQESLLRLAIAKAFLEKLESDPYAALKKAHAGGKVIQYQSANGSWNDLEDFDFCTLAENYRIKPEPEPSTFEAHGKTWTKHKAGDPMPCDGKRRVELLLGDMCLGKVGEAKLALWNESPSKTNQIIGWRYADEQPEPETPWTPAVGDVVQLKSGGPKMMILSQSLNDDDELLPDTWFCGWIDPTGNAQTWRKINSACLTPVTE